MEPILKVAAVVARHAGAKMLQSEHICAAVKILHPSAGENPREVAGRAYLARYKATSPPMSRGEKTKVGHLRTQARVFLAEAKSVTSVRKDAAACLRGVLNSLDEGALPAPEKPADERLIEVACILLCATSRVTLVPEDLVAAARLLRPGLDLTYKSAKIAKAGAEAPGEARKRAVRRGMKKKLKETIAAIFENGRMSKAAPACFQYLVDACAKERPLSAARAPEAAALSRGSGTK
jgi:histone H3/H4